MTKLALFLTALTSIATAMPRKVMVIGDSQSEEYRFEIPFSAPASDPLEANTMNWIELLSEHREEEFDFGEYKRNAFEWRDFRNAGYEYNWSIPGAFIETHLDLLTSSFFENQEYLPSKFELFDQLDEVEAVVIFLGGNDIRTVYSKLHRDEPPAGWPQNIVAEMEEVIEIIRNQNADIPILVGDFPNVGGTEKTRLSHPEKAGQRIASGHVANANRLLKEMLDSKNLPLFEVSQVTTDLLSNDPIRVGNVEFLPFGHPENKPRNLLCRDGFHPSTSTQARIANLIVDALGTETGWSFTTFSDQEILVDILGIDPTVDDAYLAWIDRFPVSNDSLIADPDGDGLENLGEYALGKNPLVPDMPQMRPDLTFDYDVDPTRTDYVVTRPAGSDDLAEWFFIAQSPPVTLERKFFRLDFSLPQ